MDKQQGILITAGFGSNLEDVIGRFLIADTPRAKVMWEMLKENPKLFEFAIGYIEDPESGKCELVEISLVTRKPDEQSPTS